MIRSTHLTGALCALFLLPLLSSCNLLDVTDTEESNSGRGAKVFDPYQASASGAIKLSLQVHQRLRLYAHRGVRRPHSLVPRAAYPDTCENLERLIGAAFSEVVNPVIDPARVPPRAKLQILNNTKYFLNQLSITDTIVNKHTNPADSTDAVTG